MRVFIQLIMLFLPALMHGQIVDHHELLPDTAQRYRFEMRDGSIVYGHVVESDRFSLTVETLQLGTVIMQKTSVREVRAITMEDFHYFQGLFRNPIPNEHLLTSSAHMLEKGRVQYRPILLLIHAVEVGVHDKVSLGGGFEAFSILDRSVAPHFFLRGKFVHKILPKLHVAILGMAVNGPARYSWWRDQERVTEGLVQGLVTYGDTDHHITMGGGMAMREERRISSPFFSLAGTARLGRSVALVGEGLYVVETAQKVLGFGVRVLTPSVSLDVGAMADLFDEHDRVGIPYLAMSFLL